MEDEWADWTTEDLRDYEQSLYDDEVAGDDTWYIREKVLLELNWREAHPGDGQGS